MSIYNRLFQTKQGFFSFKWMPPESLRDGLFSDHESLRDGLFSEKSESDVVSIILLFSMYGL